MLCSSLPNKRANPSASSIPFVPRQIMLAASSAVAAVEDSKTRRKEKKERKKRSSETLHLDGTEVGEASRNGLGRDVLLRSIAAFLDGSGFSRTLSVFQSETRLEVLGSRLSSFVITKRSSFNWLFYMSIA